MPYIIEGRAKRDITFPAITLAEEERYGHPIFVLKEGEYLRGRLEIRDGDAFVNVPINIGGDELTLAIKLQDVCILRLLKIQQEE